MYKVAPKGINIRQNERTVQDGYLQESINMQWRDGSYRPIPERLASDITNTSDKDEIILHKVSDEDKINVLMFDTGVLSWYGIIEDGIYTAFGSPVLITDFPTVTDFDSFSFTILNGLIYAMSSSQEFYYRLQFNEANNEYELKDMYEWKLLIPFYPTAGAVLLQYYSDTVEKYVLSTIGYIATRFALVLKTGEVVLHSPIYISTIQGFNWSSTDLVKGDVIDNIMTFINTDFLFYDTDIFDDNISAINIYASIPSYLAEFPDDPEMDTINYIVDSEDARGIIINQAENPFYLIKTIEDPTPSDEILMLYAGDLDNALEYDDYKVTKIDMATIAAGEVMPVDNFSYHKVYGKLTSSNGRIIIDKPKTVLTSGHIRALAKYISPNSDVGFEIETEDGYIEGVSYEADYSLPNSSVLLSVRGLLSYPDSRATYAGTGISTGNVHMAKLRANNAHNMACAFNISDDLIGAYSVSRDGVNNKFDIQIAPTVEIDYTENIKATPADRKIDLPFYTSDNRIQFSEAGEFSVWPASNSYRVGEGKVMFVGINSVDPGNTDYIAPLVIGTTDGVYTVNFDVTGTNLIQSITKAANMPALSTRNLNIDQSIIYVSDKGLMAVVNGQLTNLTEEFFPEQGATPFPDPNVVYPNYSLLASNLAATPTYLAQTLASYLGGGYSNNYALIDIIEYMTGAVFAYDGRRNNLWCSNPSQTYSLVYNIQTKQWNSSTYIFNQAIDLYSVVDSDQGDIYSRYLTKNTDGNLDILSGEDSETMVDTLMLTRPIKIQNPDVFKTIERLISRCELYVEDGGDGNFTFGVWGKQDLNKNKVNIPLVAINDNSTFTDNIRQDIPIGRQKGKYKTITILQGGKMLPNSSVDGFEIKAYLVDNKILR